MAKPKDEKAKLPNIKDLRIQTMQVSRLKGARYNPRQIKKPAMAGLRASVEKFGLVEPIIWNERTGRVVGGHQRLQVLRDLGKVDTQVVVVDLAEKDEKALNLALNNPALQGQFTAAVGDIINELRLSMPDLHFALRMDEIDVGWSPKDKGDDPGAKLDEADKLAKKWGTKRGQLWLLGDHRLLCGDSTNAKDVARLMGGHMGDFMVSSPPYNVGVEYSAHDDTQVKWSEYEKFLISVLGNVLPCISRGRAVAWNIGTSPKTHHCRQHLLLEDRFGLTYYRQMVWKKVGVPVPLWFNTKRKPVARRFTPNYQHEVVLIFTKGPLQLGAPTGVDELCTNDVFEYGQQFATTDLPSGKTRSGAQSNLDRRSHKAHPAAFPVRIPAMFITHLSAPGEIVIEPFCGAGATIIACEQLGRKCYGMEIDPAYVAVTLQRWSEMAGKKPVLG